MYLDLYESFLGSEYFLFKRRMSEKWTVGEIFFSESLFGCIWSDDEGQNNKEFIWSKNWCVRQWWQQKLVDGLCRSIDVFFFSFSFDRELCVHLLVIFCFPCSRPNSSGSSPTSDNLESSSTSKTSTPLNRQSSDELNGQQGKRKFSLSQYKEHKRLKSNEVQSNTLADTDMRLIHMENSKVRTSVISRWTSSMIISFSHHHRWQSMKMVQRSLNQQ